MAVNVEKENVKRSVKFFKEQSRFDKDIVALAVSENGLKSSDRLTQSEMTRLVDKTAKRKVALA